MNSQSNRDQSNESNAGAGMNDNESALHKGVRRNASHPGDASNAAGMRKEAGLQDDREPDGRTPSSGNEQGEPGR